ncbi:MAG: transcriptional repressor [Thermovirga sp.]|nr:transcriptional repressor [Thermovirga sp.]
MERVDVLNERLSKANLKLTKARKAIWETIASADEPLSIPQIMNRAKKMCPSLGLVTVYRTLAVMEKAGLIKLFQTKDGSMGYVSSVLAAESHHVQCIICKKVVEFECTGMEDTIRAVEEKTGFCIERHNLELFGICPSCMKKSLQKIT